MVLTRFLLAFLIAAAALSPAGAHKDHQKKMAEAAEKAEQARQGKAVVVQPMSPVVHEAVKEDIAALEAEAEKPVHLRLIDWLGRIHPFLVHFPLALFPVALVALVLARRRGGAVDTIRALIIVGGAASLGAALLGWFNAGFGMTDKDPLLASHRWLGTLLGLAGAALAAWAWRRASAVDSRAMVAGLALVTILLLVQGWLGAALIHGIDHLAW